MIPVHVDVSTSDFTTLALESAVLKMPVNIAFDRIRQGCPAAFYAHSRILSCILKQLEGRLASIIGKGDQNHDNNY
jgi:hypothetical protein